MKPQRPWNNYDPHGSWDNTAESPFRYGDTDTTYIKAMQFLDGPGRLVEDWGCGGGWARRFVTQGTYRGVDANFGPGTDVVTDLRTYRSQADGVLLRHVLEHNRDWAVVLANAIATAPRVCVVLFTPLVEETHISHEFEIGIVDISFKLDDLLVLLPDAKVEHFPGPGTIYNTETVIYYEALLVSHTGS